MPPATNANRAFQGRANQNNVEPMGSANPTQLVVERNVRYILVRPNPGESPDITAKFHNGLQEMAEASRLGIPIVFSTDPRHSGGRGGSGKPVISQWPDQLGLAAARDPELVRQFGQIAAKELRAIGIQCLLGPMADTSTEPRWNRINGTFGEDANLNATLIKAIVEGFQGKQLGPESVMTVTKHFPGDGPVKDGYDGHNNYGPSVILAGVKDGGIPTAVVDAAARRILRPVFQLGLFENPYVNPEQAKATVASERFLAAGYAAQVRSTVLLKNANGVLPAAAGKKIYVEGIAREMAAQFGTVVDDPKGAGLAILRVASPATAYPYGGAFAGGGGRGGAAPVSPPPLPTYGITLAYGNSANWTVLDGIRKVAAAGTPTVVIVNMDKPVILTEFIDSVEGLLGAFGASDAALLDVVFGRAKPTGKLPFDLPSDMPSVMAQAADVPFDINDPLFKFGFGLTYGR